MGTPTRRPQMSEQPTCWKSPNDHSASPNHNIMLNNFCERSPSPRVHNFSSPEKGAPKQSGISFLSQKLKDLSQNHNEIQEMIKKQKETHKQI